MIGPGSRRRLMAAALVLASGLLILVNLPLFASTGEGVGALARDGWSGLIDLLRGPVRVGIQIGHLDVHAHPEELANLRYSTGGHANGVDEVVINQRVALELRRRLEARGVEVDVLPATVPPNYRADLLVSLHADSSPDAWRRGYKSAHFEPARNSLEPLLKSYLDQAYTAGSGLPDDSGNITRNMLRYYAFNSRRFHHTVATRTPAVLVEMGYISNASDLAYLSDPARPAEALAAGILAYLEARGRLPRGAPVEFAELPSTPEAPTTPAP